jgi:flagellar biosynthesis GTPase FlhF
LPDAALQAEILDGLAEPGACDVRDRLLESGASLELTAAIVQAVVASGARGTWAIDAAAHEIVKAFPVLPSPRRRKGSHAAHLFAFVGPTGAGKTTTLAKLGRRLTAAGREVVYASLDAPGTSALERLAELEADTDRVELPLIAVRNADELTKELAKRPGTDIVLLDTPGLSPREDERLDLLAREVDRLGGRGPMDVFLVLAATRSRAAIDLTRRAFARTAPTGYVLTKLDETDQPTAVLEEVARTRLPLAFLCDGMDTRAHLARPTPDRLANLVLRGRYA